MRCYEGPIWKITLANNVDVILGLDDGLSEELRQISYGIFTPKDVWHLSAICQNLMTSSLTFLAVFWYKTHCHRPLFSLIKSESCHHVIAKKASMPMSITEAGEEKGPGRRRKVK